MTCEPGYYCINGIKEKCPENTYGENASLTSATCSGRCLSSVNKRSDAGATSCSCYPTFINDTATNECVCDVGKYRVMEDVPRCDKCPAGYVKPNPGNEKCDPCGTFQAPDDELRECATSIPKLLALLLSIAIAASTTIFLIRKRFKKVKVRADTLERQKGVVERKLKREKQKVVELQKLSKPSSEQEAMFQNYRQIIKYGHPEDMPYKIIMYTMKNIQIQKSLGKGGYGEVFHGKVISEHYGETIKKDVALKQLLIKSTTGTEDILCNFLKEVRSLAGVGKHENIVAFYGVAWDKESFPSIVLEYVAGGELAAYLDAFAYSDEKDPRGIANPTLMSIALGIVRGVQHIHSKNMIHRDIKPQNVLLDISAVDELHPPTPKIADFGESRDEDKDLTMTYVGTPYYIAPEVFRGERYGTSADIFSLGILLNQMDTLQHPSTGVNFNAANTRNPGSFRPLIREGVPERILAILKACTRYDSSPERGAEGDLSYGRPTIDALLEMVTMLAKSDDLDTKTSKERREAFAAEARNAALLADVQVFMDSSKSTFDEHVRALPSASLRALVELVMRFAKERQL